MGTGESIQLDTSELIDIFEEDDWDFFNCTSDLECFGEYEDEFIEKEQTKLDKALSIAGIGLATTISVSVCIFLYDVGFTYFTGSGSTSKGNTEVTPKYVEGTTVSSKEEVAISRMASNYFGVLTYQTGFSELDKYCINGSKLASTEAKYRSNSSFSYDTNDCYARAIRAFSTYITLDKVTKVVKSNGVYYVYCNVKIPSSSNLLEYYQLHSADMSYFFKTNAITSINITKFMLKAISGKDVPVSSKELCLEVVLTDDSYMIKSDSGIENFCIEPYVTSINTVVDILGGNIMS